MRWVLWIAGSLGVMIALVAIVGTRLPVKHTASRTARIGVPPPALYPMIVELARTSEVPVRFEREEPPSLLIARIADAKLPFGGTWTYRIAPAASGSDLTITEDGEVYNPFFRFMSRFVLGHHATMDQFIKKLEARAR
jgi:hypothetical protein